MSKTSPTNWYRQYDRTAKDISDGQVKTRKEVIEPFMRLSSNGNGKLDENATSYKEVVGQGIGKLNEVVAEYTEKVTELREAMKSETEHPIYTYGLGELDSVVSKQKEFSEILNNPENIRKLVKEEFKKKLLPDLPFTKPGVFYQAGGIVTNPDGMQEMSLHEKDKFLDQVLPHMKPIPLALQQWLLNNKERSQTFDQAIQDKAVQLFTEHEPQKDPTMAQWKNRYNAKFADDTTKLEQFGKFVNNHMQALDIVQSAIEQIAQQDTTILERDKQVTSKLLPILAEFGYEYLDKNRDKLIIAITESGMEKSSNIEEIVENFTYKKLAIDHEEEIKGLATTLVSNIGEQKLDSNKLKEVKSQITTTLVKIAQKRGITIDETSLQEASEAIIIRCTEATGQSLTLQQRIAKFTDSIKNSFPKIFREYAKARKYSAILAEHQDIKGVLGKNQQTLTSRSPKEKIKKPESFAR